MKYIILSSNIQITIKNFTNVKLYSLMGLYVKQQFD